MLRTISSVFAAALIIVVTAATCAEAANRGRSSSAGYNRVNVNRGNVNRISVNRGNVNRGNVNRGNVNRGNVNRGNVNRVNVNRVNVNRGNVNRGNVNRVNVNRVNVNRGNVNRGNVNRGSVNLGRVGAVGTSRIGAGPGRVNANWVRPANVAVVRLGGGGFAPVWRAGAARRIWWGGGWRVWAPITALGAVVVAGAYYWPDAYIATSRSYCEGITPEGCRLNWQMVDFEGGGSDWQCVQYCPRPGAAPPPRTVALVTPPPMTQSKSCEISIFSEPNFAGTNATANSEEPNLGSIGWQNQIASVRVASGTWDFFSDPEFTGETMRLQPGEYADLGPQWSKRSGSFMCALP